ncbi:MAG: S4 domain-containing protein, partial [Leptospiraceae bacterium]|nr:S4 domain-containing protein [Leptospiraceae bacterium]
MTNFKKKLFFKKKVTKTKKKFVSSKKKTFLSKKKSLSKKKVFIKTSKRPTSKLKKQKTKKTKPKIRIKPNALEKTEELLTSVRQNLLEQLEENESPLLVTLDSTQELQEPIRINRYLARCGLGSRRDVEQFIKEGKIFVNGKVETNLTRKIDPQKDEVTFEGTKVTPLQKDSILVLNKPAGYLCSHFDVHHEKTVFNLLPPQFRRM